MPPSRPPGGGDAAAKQWATALTFIESNRILVRGYPLDEIMGRLPFAEAVYLLLTGELPTPSIGRLMDAMLVSFIDHGATPPSTLAGPQHGDHRRVDPGCGGRGRAGLRAVPRRRCARVPAAAR
ncbi:MAG: citrate/2-methylcitrate synthase [Vicinamibacterales bacterium]